MRTSMEVCDCHWDYVTGQDRLREDFYSRRCRSVGVSVIFSPEASGLASPSTVDGVGR